MAKDVKRRFTVTLDVDTKSMEKQIKGTVDNLKTILADMSNSSNNMGYFKEVIDYIGQIDRALLDLKSKHGDAFGKMFGTLDEDLRGQLEKLFRIPSYSLGGLDSIKSSLSSLDASASTKEFQDLADELNTLYLLAGKSKSIDIDKQILGSDGEARIKAITDALDNFATVWDEVVGRVRQGFAFDKDFQGEYLAGYEQGYEEGLAEGKKAGGSTTKSGGGSVVEDTAGEDFKKKVDELDASFDKLQKLSLDRAANEEFDNKIRELHKLYDDWASASDGEAENLEKKINNLVKEMSKLGTTKEQVRRLNGVLKSEDTFLDDDYVPRNIDEVIKSIHSVFQQDDLDAIKSEFKSVLDIIKQIGDTASLGDVDAERICNKLTAIREEFKRLETQGAITAEEYNRVFNAVYGASVKIRKLKNEQEDAEAPKQSSPEKSSTGKSGAGGSSTSSTGTTTTDGAKTNIGGSSTPSAEATVADGTKVDVDFTTLESTIKTEAGAIAQKLDGPIPVKLVEDSTKDVQNIISGIKSTVDQISADISAFTTKSNGEQTTPDKDAIKANLLKLLQFVDAHNSQKIDGKYQHQELSAQVMSDGSISVGYGEDGTVPYNQVASAILANLSKSLLIDIHSHPYDLLGSGERVTMDAFSGSNGDLRAFRSDKVFGAKLSGLITGNILKVFNPNALSDAQYTQFLEALRQVEKEYAADPIHGEHVFRLDDGTFGYKMQQDYQGQHAVVETLDEIVYEALKRTGFSKDGVDAGVFKSYNLTDPKQLDALATTLVELSSASREAYNPVDRLADIIRAFGGDLSSNSVKALLTSFQKGEVTAADAFNGSQSMIRVNQDMVDSMMKIDTANEMPLIESLLSQISTVLNTISAGVSAISSSVQHGISGRLDTAIRDIVDFQNGKEIDTSAYGIKPIYDSQNISEAKNEQVIRMALGAQEDFISKFAAVNADIAEGNVDVDKINALLDQFMTALRYSTDAKKQISAYDSSGMYEPAKIGSALARDSAQAVYKGLADGDILPQMLKFLSSAKQTVDKQKSSYTGEVQREPVQIDASTITGLTSIQTTLDNIHALVNNILLASSQDDKQVAKTSDDDNESQSDATYTAALNSITQHLQSIDSGSQRLATEETAMATKTAVDSIYGALSKEKDKTTEKESSDVYQLLTSKLTKSVASEDGLLSIKEAIEQLTKSIATGNNQDSTRKSFMKLVDSLNLIAKGLEGAAKDIVKHQEARKTDKSIAGERIVGQYGELSSAASVAVQNMGEDVQIAKMKALEDGIVRVDGAVKDSSGTWKGFTVDIDESNKAINLAIQEQSAFARKLNQTEEAMKAISTETVSAEPLDEEAMEAISTEAVSFEPLDEETKIEKWDRSASELETIKNTMKSIRSEFASIGFDKTKFEFDTSSDEYEILDQYDRIFAVLEKYEQEIKEGKAIELSAINEEIAALREKISLYKEVKTTAQSASQLETIKGLRGSMSKDFKSLGFEKAQFEYGADSSEYAIIGQYDELIAELQRYEQEVKDGKDVEISAIAERVNALKQLIQQYKSAAKHQLDMISGARNGLNKDYKSLFENGKIDIDTKRGIATKYDDAIKKLQEWEAAAQKGQQIEDSKQKEILETISLLRQEIELKKEAVSVSKKTAPVSKSKFGDTVAITAMARHNKISSAKSSDDFGSSQAFMKKYKVYEAAYLRLISLQKTLNLFGSPSESQKVEFKEAQNEYSMLAREMENVIRTSNRLASSSSEHGKLGADFVDNLDGRKKALEDFIRTQYGAKASIDKFNSAYSECMLTINNGDGTFTKATASVDAFANRINVATGETSKATGALSKFIGELGLKFKSISAYLISMFGIQEFIQYFKQGVQYVKEIDSALTDLKKVTNETDVAYSNFLHNISNTASEIGSTISELTNMTAAWARLGYSMNEAAKLAESTAILLNVSEFTSADDATEALISTMQAFQYTASESQHVVDILNEVKVTCLLIQ